MCFREPRSRSRPLPRRHCEAARGLSRLAGSAHDPSARRPRRSAHPAHDRASRATTSPRPSLRSRSDWARVPTLDRRSATRRACVRNDERPQGHQPGGGMGLHAGVPRDPPILPQFPPPRGAPRPFPRERSFTGSDAALRARSTPSFAHEQKGIVKLRISRRSRAKTRSRPRSTEPVRAFLRSSASRSSPSRVVQQAVFLADRSFSLAPATDHSATSSSPRVSPLRLQHHLQHVQEAPTSRSSCTSGTARRLTSTSRRRGVTAFGEEGREFMLKGTNAGTTTR